MRKSLSILLAFAMMLSMVYIPAKVKAASASDYITYSYSSNLRVKTTQNLDLRTFPAENAGSVTTTVATGTELLVRGMVYSTEGYYFYKVAYYNRTLYCRAAYCTVVAHLTGDLTISDVLSPASIEYGTSFGIQGNITSTYNVIGKVTAGLYKSSHLNGLPHISSSDTVNGKSYTLASSTVDNNLKFSSASRGVYTYAVTAEAISNYYDAVNNKFATSTQTVVLETQQCIVTDYNNANTRTGWGIDVSNWQGAITWSSVANQVDFAILRLGYGTNIDSRFVSYANSCETYGIPWGVYLYSHALTQSAAIAEANFVVNTLKSYGLKPDLQVYYDLEDYDEFYYLSTSTKRSIGQSFCEIIQDAGYTAGIYTYPAWFTNCFNTNYFSSISKWICQLTSNYSPSFDGGLWLWQYSWEGSITGISGDVDCNRSYFEYSSYTSDTSVWGSSTYYPVHAMGTVNSSVNVRTYPSSSYSSATTYSAGKQVEILGLYKNSSGEYWYHIPYNSSNYFVYASYVDIDEFLYDDIAIHGASMASNISQGSSYALSGTVTSKTNRLGKVYGKVYAGEDTSASPKISGSASPAIKEYNLNSSAVDNGMSFGSLSSGYYTYEVSADIYSYYVSNGSLYYKTKNVVVYTAPFTVGGATVTMPESAACSHTEASRPAVSATCTSTGLTAGSYCTTCGETLTAQTTVPALGHSYADGVCTRCGTACTHRFSGGSCTVCGISCSHNYYLGSCTICNYKCPHHYSDGICGWCSYMCPHTVYQNGFCAVCGTEEPNSDYYLFGYINGVNYGCEEDAENLGEYLFHDGTITVNFTEDSYIGIKLGDNSIWYMADGDVDEATDTVTYQDSSDLQTPGKLFIPGRRTVTLTMTINADGTLTVTRTIAPCTHDWVDGECTICYAQCSHNWINRSCTLCGMAMPIPEITLKNYTVSFDGEVRYNVYFTLTNAENIPLEDIGLLTWTMGQTSGTYDTANEIIPGALTDGDQYMVHSHGVPAKQLSDSLYFKIYVRLPDGSYVYTPLKNVNAKTYAMGRIEKSSDARMKALCVAMLNYGAAAQTYFGYKPYNLMNAGLTDAQKALISPYNSSMVDQSVAVPTEKAGIFTKNGFGTCSITASFEAAFVLNYYLNTTYTPDGDVTLYYWTLDDFNNATVLTKENATGTMITVPTDTVNQYWGEVTGIAAKELDQTVFVAAVYTSGGVEYTTSVMNYSMGRYCVKLASNSASAQQDLAKATAVYGYYAKEYFKYLAA